MKRSPMPRRRAGIRAEIRAERLRSAMWWLTRGLRALAGIEPIRTAPRRN